MGEECPRVHRLAMSGQRPSDLGVTSVLTPVTFAPNVTTLNGEPSTGSARTSHVTMGAVSRPARRPDDVAGDAEVISRIRAGDRRAVDDLYDRFRLPAFALARPILADDPLAAGGARGRGACGGRFPGASGAPPPPSTAPGGASPRGCSRWSTTRRSTPSAARSPNDADASAPRRISRWTSPEPLVTSRRRCGPG